jgi:hypothetical protein
MKALALIVAALLFAVATAEARDRRQAAAFRRHHPCPATLQTAGPCPGWIIDHRYPLCAGGLDAPQNMQWQTAPEAREKDVRERSLCACLKAKKATCAWSER